MDTMLFRFTASGPTPEAAFSAFAAQDRAQPHDPFRPRADLSKVTQVKVADSRDRLRADGCFAGQDGGPLGEDDADWLADRLIEDYDPIVRSGAAALLLHTPGDEPTWCFFGWSTRGEWPLHRPGRCPPTPSARSGAVVLVHDGTRPARSGRPEPTA
ncbi:hypothetical protein [Streptomyces sp. XY66]|uniref:hypothetical protein n=1 Tax=Streptomyces sp. XY66 TaxID=1415563 RepID=UPI0018FE32F8|nr:hypothetical protein [Streptomyces sp. XY66]